MPHRTRCNGNRPPTCRKKSVYASSVAYRSGSGSTPPSPPPPCFVLGAIVWGAGMGVHDSTMRAAVADFVPPHRRGAGHGTFTAIYGLAWLAGAALIGVLYEHSRLAV